MCQGKKTEGKIDGFWDSNTIVFVPPIFLPARSFCAEAEKIGGKSMVVGIPKPLIFPFIFLFGRSFCANAEKTGGEIYGFWDLADINLIEQPQPIHWRKAHRNLCQHLEEFRCIVGLFGGILMYILGAERHPNSI